MCGVTVTAPAFESAVAQGASIFRYLSLKYKSLSRARTEERKREAALFSHLVLCASSNRQRLVATGVSDRTREREECSSRALSLRKRPLFTRLRQRNCATPRASADHIITGNPSEYYFRDCLKLILPLPRVL